MIENNGAYLTDSWEDLKQNPVFRRAMMPSGIRAIWRSPIVRAVVLTALALGIVRMVDALFFGRMVFVAIAATLMWTIIYSVQHYLCWLELLRMARSGTLSDYLNSGLTRSDIAMGMIYPARISENIASVIILVYFLVTADQQYKAIVMLLVFCIVMRVAQLFRPPSLFIPDAENYLRMRNPVALFLISFSIFVPLLIWFTFYFSTVYGIILLMPILKIRDPQIPSVGGFLAAIFLSRWPSTKFQQWRLKRFYLRQNSLDDLFEKYM